MSKQSVSLIEFPELYNILKEIKHLFNFDIINYKNSQSFIKKKEFENTKDLNTVIVLHEKNKKLFSYNKINKNSFLIIDKNPIKIEKFIDMVNIQLIKMKYNFQSQLNINKYTLNLNTRTIIKKEDTLKLTEKEIDIILFLNDQKVPRSVVDLQNEVWGYSSGLDTHTVETHIYRLRKKINKTFNDENFIISEAEGYKI